MVSGLVVLRPIRREPTSDDRVADNGCRTRCALAQQEQGIELVQLECGVDSACTSQVLVERKGVEVGLIGFPSLRLNPSMLRVCSSLGQTHDTYRNYSRCLRGVERRNELQGRVGGVECDEISKSPDASRDLEKTLQVRLDVHLCVRKFSVTVRQPYSDTDLEIGLGHNTLIATRAELSEVWEDGVLNDGCTKLLDDLDGRVESDLLVRDVDEVRELADNTDSRTLEAVLVECLSVVRYLSRLSQREVVQRVLARNNGEHYSGIGDGTCQWPQCVLMLGDRND